MNIAITNGGPLSPPSFAAGLSAWSREHGTPGSATWAGQANAAIVSADQDFGTCLEITKTAKLTRLRFMGETPIRPGTYLRVSVRLKAVAGAKPSVRIAGWAGDQGRAHVGGLTETGPSVALSSFGKVVEISAVIGSGARSGVDMVWGGRPVYGHFGLDLTGANGGTVRIDSVRIEDVTPDFLREMIDLVDVRDFGARGDGTTDDRAAFEAADNAAKGRVLVVPEGTYRIGSDLTLTAPVRFSGRLTMPRQARLILMGSFDFNSYAEAFGDETEALKRALQALFGYTDHATLDLCGRKITLTEPLVMTELAPGLQSFSSRRLICNGWIHVEDGAAWRSAVANSRARYDVAQSRTLSDVENVANIEIGSLVTGPGVGREVYVRAKNVGAGTVTLSQPLYGGSGTRSYRFERFRYAFDFLGMESCARVNFADIEFSLGDAASFLMLPAEGEMFHIRDCFISRPKDRGITSVGRACQDLLVDRCQFLSSEMHLKAQDRRSVAINVNANDAKIRDNRFVRFGTFMVATGTGHLLVGNHWFQGDNSDVGKRVPGLVIAQTNCKMAITGNYVDNNVIEWTNEYSADPNFGPNQYSFGGLSITGNHFTVQHVLSDFAWLSVKPYGTGHHIHGLTVSGNVFLVRGAKIKRVEKVDTTFADLDYGRMRNISFQGNTFNGVLDYIANPVQITHTQSSTQSSWVVPISQHVPFRAWAKNVDSVTAVSMIKDGAGKHVPEMPWVRTQRGPGRQNLQVEWSRPVKGKVVIRARMDDPN
ncbi:glycosyl hydrolase family 28-related protein [Paracoccus aerodenitrificans]|uniref:glycosyl hydrolase family 28-related protein n=1 Tax=Paracoccus aerodenitrificans TaxID=3017781 RepID=UPI0022F0D2CD|nr:glycosyl hydrolase family 28-related protein [Paracoccus aerodenitrificans]WBU62689.1 glycosyl hydrolase family 28-related protein [Paracoccus aerodenitrificans]